MPYYAYENWVAHGHVATIHEAGCSFCNHGKGLHRTGNTKCGKWHGPLSTYEEARASAEATGASVSDCSFCTPRSA